MAGISGYRKCNEEEQYKFVNGRARVPGFTFGREPVYVTFAECLTYMEKKKTPKKKRRK